MDLLGICGGIIMTEEYCEMSKKRIEEYLLEAEIDG